MTARLDGYVNCRCGRHWWSWNRLQWVRLTLRGEAPIEHDQTPECCHVSRETREKINLLSADMYYVWKDLEREFATAYGGNPGSQT